MLGASTSLLQPVPPEIREVFRGNIPRATVTFCGSGSHSQEAAALPGKNKESPPRRAKESTAAQKINYAMRGSQSAASITAAGRALLPRAGPR